MEKDLSTYYTWLNFLLPGPQKVGGRFRPVPVVGLGELVGHGEDGQGSVFLWAERLIDPAAVDQTPLPALQEHLTQQLLVIFTVQLEGLEEMAGAHLSGGDGALLAKAVNHAELT